MTASMPPSGTRSHPGAASGIFVGAVAGLTVLGLILVAASFYALAIALPIVGPIVEYLDVYVPAADLALAERFATFWWVFAAIATASLAGGGVVLVKAVEHLDGGERI